MATGITRTVRLELERFAERILRYQAEYVVQQSYRRCATAQWMGRHLHHAHVVHVRGTTLYH